MEIATAYRSAQRSFVSMCATFTDDDWASPVPCNPGWTVRDVLSHVAGVTNDIVEGNIDGAATDPWTATQVERWRGHPVDEMIARWNGQIDGVAEMLQAIGERRPPIDCHAHEHDVRHAIGRPGDRDSDLIRWISMMFAEGSVGRPVEVDFDGDGSMTIVGRGEPIGLRGVTRFELVRSRLGRRSREQVEAWAWTDPPTADELDAWFVFGPSPAPIEE